MLCGRHWFLVARTCMYLLMCACVHQYIICCSVCTLRLIIKSYSRTYESQSYARRMENCDLVELAIEPHPTKLKPKFHPKKLKLVATILSFQPTPQQVFFFSPPIPLVLPPFFLTEKMKCLFNAEESGEIAVSNTRHQWPCIAADSASVYTAASIISKAGHHSRQILPSRENEEEAGVLPWWYVALRCVFQWWCSVVLCGALTCAASSVWRGGVL